MYMYVIQFLWLGVPAQDGAWGILQVNIFYYNNLKGSS